MPERWDLIDTPDPSSTSFVVRVKPDTVSLNPDLIPEPGDLFKNLGAGNYGWIPDPALAADARFGLYQYVDNSEWEEFHAKNFKTIFEHRNKRYGAYQARIRQPVIMTYVLLGAVGLR